MAKLKEESRIYREWIARTKPDRLLFCPFCLTEKTPFTLTPTSEWTRLFEDDNWGYLAFKMPYFMKEFVDGLIYKGSIHEKGFCILATASVEDGGRVQCRPSCPLCFTAYGLYRAAIDMRQWLNGVRGWESRKSFLSKVERGKYSREEVFQLFNGVCQLCFLKITDGEKWETDHQKPVSQGGSDTLENIRLAHAFCNRVKKDHPQASPAYYRRRRREKGLRWWD